MKEKRTLYRSRSCLPFIGLLLFGLQQPVFSKTYYKWVDEEGVTHYEASPPKAEARTKTPVEKIKTSNKLPRDAKLAQERLESQREARDQAKKDTTSAKEKSKRAQAIDEYEQQVKENCEISRNNLNILQQSPRVREKDDKGEFRFLSEEEHQNRIKEAQKYVTEHCD